MGANFRTCVFGGFEKQDVVTFIEQQSRQHQEAMEAVEYDKTLLKEAVSRMEEECARLSEKAQAYDTLSAEVERYRLLSEELQEQLSFLRSENDRLRGPAEEYGKIKDHIADIEINAHHRTEEFRTDMIAKLRGVIDRQRQWCEQERNRYDAMNQSLLEKLHNAEQVIRSDKNDAFGAMLESLDALDNSLQ